jgi:hypothetical protein
MLERADEALEGRKERPPKVAGVKKMKDCQVSQLSMAASHRHNP